MKMQPVYVFILQNNDLIGNTAAQQKAGMEPTMHTNEEDISRVRC